MRFVEATAKIAIKLSFEYYLALGNLRESRDLSVCKLPHYGHDEIMVREQPHERLRRVCLVGNYLPEDVHRRRCNRLEQTFALLSRHFG